MPYEDYPVISRQPAPPVAHFNDDVTAKMSYTNPAFEFDQNENFHEARRYGRKSADDILNANHENTIYTKTSSGLVTKKTYLTDGPENQKITYLLEDPVIEKKSRSMQSLQTKPQIPDRTASSVWQQGAIDLDSHYARKPVKLQDQWDVSDVHSDEVQKEEGNLTPAFEKQLNAILFKDQVKSKSQPSSPIRKERKPGYQQQQQSLNLFRPITSSSGTGHTSSMISNNRTQTYDYRICKEKLEKRKSNIQDELTDLEQHFEALALDSEDEVRHSDGHPKAAHLMGHPVHRVMHQDRHEPSPESWEVAQFNKTELQPFNYVTKHTSKPISNQPILRGPEYRRVQVNNSNNNNTSNINTDVMSQISQNSQITKQHFPKRKQETKPGTIQPFQNKSEGQLLSEPGRQYGTKREQKTFLTRLRASSLERPRSNDKSQSEPSSPIKERRPSLPGRKSFAHGISQMIDVFSKPTLRPSNSAPNLNETSIFSSSYSIQGEPINTRASKPVVTKAHKQQTPRFVKQRNEQKSRGKSSASGSESEGYSSSGVESNKQDARHLAEDNANEHSSNPLYSQQYMSLPERESFTSRSAPNLSEKTIKQRSLVQRNIPDVRLQPPINQMSQCQQYQQHQNLQHQTQPIENPPSTTTHQLSHPMEQPILQLPVTRPQFQRHSIQVTPSPPSPSSPDKPVPNVTVTVQARQSPARSYNRMSPVKSQPMKHQPVKHQPVKQLANSRTLELVTPPKTFTFSEKISERRIDSASAYAPIRASHNSALNSPDTSHWDTPTGDNSISVILSPDEYTTSTNSSILGTYGNRNSTSSAATPTSNVTRQPKSHTTIR